MDFLRGIKAGGDMIKDGADVLGAMLLCHPAHHLDAGHSSTATAEMSVADCGPMM